MIYEMVKERLWVVPAGLAAAYLLIPRGRPADEPRDFDSFLVVQGDLPTGVQDRRNGGGPFEEFLKDSDERDSAVFETFLKTHGKAEGSRAACQAQVVAAPVEEVVEVPEPHMAKVVVMYGTEYGFSKEVAEKMAKTLKAGGKYWPQMVDMAEHEAGYDFSSIQAALVVCSTQGDGVPPTEARPFCEWLFAGKAASLEHVHFGVCALGDKSYTHFCRCGKMIDSALEAAGGKRFVAHAEVDKENWPVIDAWMEEVMGGLPKLGLRSFSETGEVMTPGHAEKSGPKKWGKSRPYPGKVIAIEGLCNVKSNDDKNTFRIEVDLGDSALTYVPGDALGIYPFNAPDVVSDLVAALGVDAAYPVTVPSFLYEDLVEVNGTYLKSGSKAALQDVLSKCYDLRTPKSSILQLLSEKPQANSVANGRTNGANGHHAPPPSLSVLKSDSKELEAYLAPRHVADVLRDFPSSKMSPEQLLDALRQLQPRLYSISSSPLEGSTRVQATIAEVKYESLGKGRIGVCSTQVSERLQLGSQLPVYIHHNPDFRLPSDLSVPIIMVGPGTGLAPFRSFILERIMQAEQSGSPSGEMLLYFGCRRSDQDYLYGDLLEKWNDTGRIKLFTAFSRMQSKKVYVQDRLRESAEQVWKYLHEKKAHFYVCGDAGSMAGSVEQQLLKIFEEKLPGGSPELAKQYLEDLSQTGRYQRDVWFS